MNRKGPLFLTGALMGIAAALGGSGYGATDPIETDSVVGTYVGDDLPAIYRLPEIHGPAETGFVDSAILPVPDSGEFPLSSPDLLAEELSYAQAWTAPVEPVRTAERAAHGGAPASAPWHAPADTFPYTPAPNGLSAQLLPAVRRGYALAQRGAMAAARAEFIQVLRRVAQSKDAVADTDVHSVALAEGLRALDEARDFVPAGIQLEAELNVRIAASSHRTPVVREREGGVRPHEAVALYHTFAEQRLALAVGGEQAGSIVLHGLGKAYARIAERDDDTHAMRSAMTMYMAALAASPTNHLAANELGVLLCRSGHVAAAAQLFEQTINLAPTATNYHNLAVAQRKLGLTGPAEANEQESRRLASLERASGALSRRAGIEWVTPEEMSGAVPPAPGDGFENRIEPAPEPLVVGARPLPKSRWQRTKDFARSFPLPGREPVETPPQQAPVAQPNPAGEAGTYWR